MSASHSGPDRSLISNNLGFRNGRVLGNFQLYLPGFFFLVNFKSPYITMAKENFIRYILLMRLILN